MFCVRSYRMLGAAVTFAAALLFLGCPLEMPSESSGAFQTDPTPVAWFVDFGYTGDGDGSDLTPFSVLGDALAAAADGDTIQMAGDSGVTSSAETPRITTALRLEASGGPVVLGGILVPQLTGMTQEDAIQALIDAGFVAGTITGAIQQHGSRRTRHLLRRNLRRGMGAWLFHRHRDLPWPPAAGRQFQRTDARHPHSAHGGVRGHIDLQLARPCQYLVLDLR